MFFRMVPLLTLILGSSSEWFISVGRKAAFCYECKYSYPDSSTSITVEAIERKMALSEKAFLERDGSLLVDLVVVVFFVMRTVPLAVTTFIHQSPSRKTIGLVLDRERLMRYFGPTLAERPQFISEATPSKTLEVSESPFFKS